MGTELEGSTWQKSRRAIHHIQDLLLQRRIKQLYTESLKHPPPHTQAILFEIRPLFYKEADFDLALNQNLITLIYWTQEELVLGITFIFSEPQTNSKLF